MCNVKFDSAGCENGVNRWPLSKDRGRPLEVVKGMEMDSALESVERNEILMMNQLCPSEY
jgi:hypothetical protein